MAVFTTLRGGAEACTLRLPTPHLPACGNRWPSPALPAQPCHDRCLAQRGSRHPRSPAPQRARQSYPWSPKNARDRKSGFATGEIILKKYRGCPPAPLRRPLLFLLKRWIEKCGLSESSGQLARFAPVENSTPIAENKERYTSYAPYLNTVVEEFGHSIRQQSEVGFTRREDSVAARCEAEAHWHGGRVRPRAFERAKTRPLLRINRSKKQLSECLQFTINMSPRSKSSRYTFARNF